ncbi:hypothetical protein [Streptomyces graminofaciens]|nr:hypothetical protein [Streptomyces graminofaciens]
MCAQDLGVIMAQDALAVPASGLGDQPVVTLNDLFQLPVRLNG